MKEPGVFWHICSHPEVPIRHSSISTCIDHIIKRTRTYIKKTKKWQKPFTHYFHNIISSTPALFSCIWCFTLQWLSVFLYPGRHWHIYPPSVFSQVSTEALQSFPPANKHSSMSEKKKKSCYFFLWNFEKKMKRNSKFLPNIVCKFLKQHKAWL